MPQNLIRAADQGPVPAVLRVETRTRHRRPSASLSDIRHRLGVSRKKVSAASCVVSAMYPDARFVITLSCASKMLTAHHDCECREVLHRVADELVDDQSAREIRSQSSPKRKAS